MTAEKTFQAGLAATSEGGRTYVDGGNVHISNGGESLMLTPGVVTASAQNFQITARNGVSIGTTSDLDPVMLVASQNASMLLNEPSDDTSVTNAIATVGWVRRNALAPDASKKGYVYMDSDGLTYKDSAVSSVKTVVTGISWNGTQIVATRENWTLTNGLVTKTASATSQTINTTTYTGN